MTEDFDGDDGLAGKVAIVTGGGAAGEGIGNGRAAAILLARAGVRVVVVDRQRDLAQHTVEMIEQEGGEALAYTADVTEDSQCAAMVEAALKQFGRLDLLDNNVGIASKGSVVDEDPQRWRHVMQVNVDSMFLVSRHAIPAMIESTGGGAIVNVASIAALRPRGMTAYSTSKGAVIALTRAMAVDHGSQGIRVNCIAPGPVYTPMVAAEGVSAADKQRCWASKALAGTWAMPFVSCCRTTPDSSPARPSWSTAVSRWWGVRAEPTRNRLGARQRRHANERASNHSRHARSSSLEYEHRRASRAQR